MSGLLDMDLLVEAALGVIDEWDELPDLLNGKPWPVEIHALGQSVERLREALK